MKTSYFANIPYIDTDLYAPVSISGKSPEWYHGHEFKVLAPKYHFFIKYKNWEIDEKEYTRCFRNEILSKHYAPDLFELINNRFSEGGKKEVVLLCYEKPKQFCHRRLVADWFEKELSIKVPEL